MLALLLLFTIGGKEGVLAWSGLDLASAPILYLVSLYSEAATRKIFPGPIQMST